MGVRMWAHASEQATIYPQLVGKDTYIQCVGHGGATTLAVALVGSSLRNLSVC